MEISQDEIFILDPDMVVSQQAGTPPGMPDLVVEQASGWVCVFLVGIHVRLATGRHLGLVGFGIELLLTSDWFFFFFSWIDGSLVSLFFTDEWLCRITFQAQLHHVCTWIFSLHPHFLTTLEHILFVYEHLLWLCYACINGQCWFVNYCFPAAVLLSF